VTHSLRKEKKKKANYFHPIVSEGRGGGSEGSRKKGDAGASVRTTLVDVKRKRTATKKEKKEEANHTHLNREEKEEAV